MKNKYFSKLKLLIEFLFIYLIYLFFLLMPAIIVSNLGSFFCKTIGPFTKTQKIVKKNLKIIFPNSTKKEIQKKTKESWGNTGKTFFELLILPKIINSYKIKIEGEENLNEIIKKNEKVIFVGIHQSNWEILLPTIDKIGIPVGGIYRHINNPYINRLILNIRNKSILSNKSFYTPKGKQSAKDIISGLNENISIILLIDQKDSAGDIITFFDQPAKTQTGFIKIARKHNMRIIPIQNKRNKDYTFTIKFHESINKINNDYSDKEIMMTIHKLIEKWIEDDPTNWFLQHNRFN